jgi:hypothetical protein
MFCFGWKKKEKENKKKERSVKFRAGRSLKRVTRFRLYFKKSKSKQPSEGGGGYKINQQPC